jgi:hypothetical protein
MEDQVFALDRAVDEATLVCRGLTDRHIVSIGADDARRLAFVSTVDAARELRKAIGKKTGTVRVSTTVAVLRPVYESLERRRDAA